MKTTRICNLLGIQYPVLQGGMLWLADAGLAAAVSNAGGLGVISPCGGMAVNGDPAENLKKQINLAGSLTDKPFGVNIPLDLKQSGVLIDIAVGESVPVVITAAGDPSVYSALLKQNKAKALHVISSVRQAKKAELNGMDAIIAEGVEAGGHIGCDEIPLFSLVPQVADAVSIPVVAAGGIVDARGAVAAMALGADGIQMGTRFIATKENIAGRDYKKAILNAMDTDTVIASRNLTPSRYLKTGFSEKLIALENSGASVEEIRNFIGFRKSPEAQIEGNLSSGEAFCGSSAGMIREIITVSEVIQEIVNRYGKVVHSLL